MPKTTLNVVSHSQSVLKNARVAGSSVYAMYAPTVVSAVSASAAVSARGVYASSASRCFFAAFALLAACASS